MSSGGKTESELLRWMLFKQAWLSYVAAELHEWLPNAVALRIASYLNFERGEAWMGVDTLAMELNTDRREVRRAVDKLAAAQVLKCTKGGGRGQTNRYWVPKRLSFALQDAVAKLLKGVNWINLKEEIKRGSARPQKSGGLHPLKRESARLKSGGSDPRDSREGKKGRKQRELGPSSPHFAEAGSLKRKSRVQPRGKPWPEDWEYGAEELREARQIIPECDQAKTADEFQKFRDFYLAKGLASHNWLASWRSWCRRGQQFIEKEAKREQQPRRQQPTAFSGAVVGIEEWLRQRKLMKH